MASGCAWPEVTRWRKPTKCSRRDLHSWGQGWGGRGQRGLGRDHRESAQVQGAWRGPGSDLGLQRPSPSLREASPKRRSPHSALALSIPFLSPSISIFFFVCLLLLHVSLASHSTFHFPFTIYIPILPYYSLLFSFLSRFSSSQIFLLFLFL